eukprot:m.703650 g.703650  ORF g.703650 m.703650 type:complete len:65 (+) comp22918_c0_seq61:2156-2350(+)
MHINDAFGDSPVFAGGNSNGVTDSVGDALTTLLVTHMGVTREEAINTKIRWKESGQYRLEHFAG